MKEKLDELCVEAQENSKESSDFCSVITSLSSKGYNHMICYHDMTPNQFEQALNRALRYSDVEIIASFKRGKRC
jgi:hypothetical protein